MVDFPLFGFRVHVGPMFLLLLGINSVGRVAEGPLYILAWCAAIFVGVIVHELGHAVVARRFGLKVGAIELTGLGGQVAHERTTPGRQLLISLAGPGAGFLLALLVLPVALLPVPADAKELLLVPILEVCIIYGVFNLLPMIPLDGGNALLAALQLLLRSRARAEIFVGTVGAALGGLLVVWSFMNRQYFLGFIGIMVVQVNFGILQFHYGQR